MAKRTREVPTEEELAVKQTPEQERMALRYSVKMYYDIQEMRMQAQGRLTRKAPDAKIQLHPFDLRRLDARLQDLEKVELVALKDLQDQLDKNSFYVDVIKPQKERFKGLGPRMSGVVLASFDIQRQDTVSKMWSFAGLAPWQCMKCKLCNLPCNPVTFKAQKRELTPGDLERIKQAELEKKEPPTIKRYLDATSFLEGPWLHPKNKCANAGQRITDAALLYQGGRAMRPIAGFALPYNAWLRMKLVGVLAGVMLKLKSPYTKFYYDYKQRKLSDPTLSWWTPAHANQAAQRYMIKMLLLDIWKLWREHEKLPVRPSYQEEKLGHKHSGPTIEDIMSGNEEFADQIDDELAALEEVPSDDVPC